ncbi:hypothetical protein [Acrocarpospora pleiomorpha]|nr:hypothetical protein [Acrocarpospora pleiomorpha]
MISPFRIATWGYDDEVVPPGTEIGQLQMGYRPSALTVSHLRRRSTAA